MCLGDEPVDPEHVAHLVANPSEIKFPDCHCHEAYRTEVLRHSVKTVVYEHEIDRTRQLLRCEWSLSQTEKQTLVKFSDLSHAWGIPNDPESLNHKLGNRAEQLSTIPRMIFIAIDDSASKGWNPIHTGSLILTASSLQIDAAARKGPIVKSLAAFVLEHKSRFEQLAALIPDSDLYSTKHSLPFVLCVICAKTLLALITRPFKFELCKAHLITGMDIVCARTDKAH